MASVERFPRQTAPLATLTAEQAAAVKVAMAPLAQAQAVAERAAMRLQGAKADLMDAEDAFNAIFRPICEAHGIDPSQGMRLLDDNTLVALERGA